MVLTRAPHGDTYASAALQHQLECMGVDSAQPDLRHPFDTHDDGADSDSHSMELELSAGGEERRVSVYHHEQPPDACFRDCIREWVSDHVVPRNNREPLSLPETFGLHSVSFPWALSKKNPKPARTNIAIERDQSTPVLDERIRRVEFRLETHQFANEEEKWIRKVVSTE